MKVLRSMNLSPWRVMAATSVALMLMATALPAHAGWWNRSKARASGTLVERTLDLTDFQRIEIRTVVELELSQGENYLVEVEIDEALEELMDIRVSGRTLIVDLEDDVDWNDDEAVRLRVTMPMLEALEVKGVAEIEGRDLELEALEIVIAGVGEIELSGKVNDLSLELSGVGEVDLRRLEATNADVQIGGVGEAKVNVTGELVARVSGLGDLRYYGSPVQVRPQVSGMGSIEAAD